MPPLPRLVGPDGLGPDGDQPTVPDRCRGEPSRAEVSRAETGRDGTGMVAAALGVRLRFPAGPGYIDRATRSERVETQTPLASICCATRYVQQAVRLRQMMYTVF